MQLSFLVSYHTVEPLIKDPLRKGQPPYKGHFSGPFPVAIVLKKVFFNLREKDNLSTEDKVADPKVSFIQRFHCSPCSMFTCNKGVQREVCNNRKQEVYVQGMHSAVRLTKSLWKALDYKTNIIYRVCKIILPVSLPLTPPLSCGLLDPGFNFCGLVGAQGWLHLYKLFVLCKSKINCKSS